MAALNRHKIAVAVLPNPRLRRWIAWYAVTVFQANLLRRSCTIHARSFFCHAIRTIKWTRCMKVKRGSSIFSLLFVISLISAYFFARFLSSIRAWNSVQFWCNISWEIDMSNYTFYEFEMLTLVSVWENGCLRTRDRYVYRLKRQRICTLLI